MSKHTQGRVELEHVAGKPADMQPEYWRIVGPMATDRPGVIADTLNRDHLIDPEEDAANARRLAHCWNHHDELVDAVRKAYDHLSDMREPADFDTAAVLDELAATLRKVTI